MDSARPHLIEDQAFLLRAVNYGDDHRILSFFTQNYGRVDLIALGAKKSQKRFGGRIDFLNYLQIDYRPSPEGRLGRLQEVQLVQSFVRVRGDYDRLMMALEWCRLLAQVLHRDQPLPKLFRSLKQGLHALEIFQQAEAVDLSFRYQALAALGYEPKGGSEDLYSLTTEVVWQQEKLLEAKKKLSQAYQECLLS